MRLTILAALIAMLATSSFAADGKPITYQSGSETVSGILYTPQGKGPFPRWL